MVLRLCSEPPVGKVWSVECKEDGVRQELPSSEANRLCCRSIRYILNGQKRNCPTVNRNILCCAEKDKQKPPTGKRPCTSTSTSSGTHHHLVDLPAEVYHRESRNRLYRHHPALPPTKSPTPYSIHNRAPEQLEGIWVHRQ